MSFNIPSATQAFDIKQFDKVALIDADRYKHTTVYNVYLRLQNGDEYSKALVEDVIEGLLFKDIFSHFKAKATVFCFSAPSKDVFRNYISQEKLYKGNRKGKSDPYEYEQKWDDMAYVVDYISHRYPSLVFADLEADDLLSMLQHPTDTFIFSHDKDLKQVVGFHYDMNLRVLMYTDEQEGFQMLVEQILKGDTVDNIPGLKGFGDKALEKFREETFHFPDFELLTAAIEKYTEKHGILHGMDMFVEMWSLISMRLNRGEHNKTKYQKAFALIDKLLEND